MSRSESGNSRDKRCLQLSRRRGVRIAHPGPQTDTDPPLRSEARRPSCCRSDGSGQTRRSDTVRLLRRYCPRTTANFGSLFLHNPNLFAVAALEAESGLLVSPPCLLGNTTSSLHRLKEVDSDGTWGNGQYHDVWTVL